jgi:hypothetical protein
VTAGMGVMLRGGRPGGKHVPIERGPEASRG